MVAKEEASKIPKEYRLQLVQQSYLVPCGILIVEGKKGECDMWIFRICLEEGPN